MSESRLSALFWLELLFSPSLRSLTVKEVAGKRRNLQDGLRPLGRLNTHPVVFEIEVRETAGGPVLETHQVRANDECSWHNVSEKLKFAEERYITIKTKFLDPACTRDAYYDNIRIRIMDIPEVLQQNHYYPFGMNMTGIEEDDKQTLSSLKENMYQYNGKEKDLSLGLHWHDYGARQYDAQLGRWNGVDPLAEKYFAYSSYNYVMNNPIIFIDPDGRDVYLNQETGEKLYDTGEGNKIYQVEPGQFASIRKDVRKAKRAAKKAGEDFDKDKAMSSTLSQATSKREVNVVFATDEKSESLISDIYKKTNETSESNEHSFFIVFDPRNSEIKFTEVHEAKKESSNSQNGLIKSNQYSLTVKGGIPLANVHAHPDQHGGLSTSSHSGTDAELSNRMSVYAVEKRQILKSRSGRRPNKFSGERNANSIMKDVLRDLYDID